MLRMIKKNAKILNAVSIKKMIWPISNSHYNLKKTSFKLMWLENLRKYLINNIKMIPSINGLRFPFLLV